MHWLYVHAILNLEYDLEKEQLFPNWLFLLMIKFDLVVCKQNTVPTDRISSVKNARAWVSMDFT